MAIMVMAAAVFGFACNEAVSQTLGNYEYTAGTTTGRMTVSDMSECDLHDKLGCLSAVRPLKVHLSTINQKSGNDCDLDAVEETAARIAGGGSIQSTLSIEGNDQPKGRLDIVFDKDGATVTANKSNASSNCGAGVGFDGRWKLATIPVGKSSTQKQPSLSETTNVSIRGFAIGSTDTKSAIDSIPNLLCRVQGNQTHCLDESDTPRHGQMYDVYVNSRNQIYGVTYTFCVAGNTTLGVIMSNIIKPFPIRPGAKMLNTKSPDTLVFDGETEDGKVRVGLLTAKSCSVGRQRGMTYSQVIVSDDLKAQ